MKVIKWINTYSGETGYVGKVNTKDRNFHNADAENAQVFKTDAAARGAITKLKSYGQGEEINNEFELEDR